MIMITNYDRLIGVISHWNPRKLTHFNGYFDEDSWSYPRKLSSNRKDDSLIRKENLQIYIFMYVSIS